MSEPTVSSSSTKTASPRLCRLVWIVAAAVGWTWVAGPFMLVLADACCPAVDSTAHVRVQRIVYLMGTRATLTAWATDQMTGLAILDEGIRVLEDTDRELSNWKRDSLVSRLNDHPIGEPYELPSDACRMFVEIRRWVEATCSAFDPAMGRLIEIWGIRGGGRRPATKEIRGAMGISGFSGFSLDVAACRVTRLCDVTLDTGGFGKGEALDRIRERLRRFSPSAWVIDLGGQVSVQSWERGFEGWNIDIAHPRDRLSPFLGVRFSGGSLSTSGGSERDRIVEGRRVGHILDPRTGRPAPFDGSVSVWHESALAADILSTALYVMGPVDGLRWAEFRGIAACFLVPEASGGIRIRLSKAFRSMVSLGEPEFSEYGNTRIRE